MSESETETETETQETDASNDGLVDRIKQLVSRR